MCARKRTKVREVRGEVFLPLRERFHASMLRDGPNPALQKFMERKAPRAHDAQVKMKVHIPEEQSLINYPKDISGTILMCESRSLLPHHRSPPTARARVCALMLTSCAPISPIIPGKTCRCAWL